MQILLTLFHPLLRGGGGELKREGGLNGEGKNGGVCGKGWLEMERRGTGTYEIRKMGLTGKKRIKKRNSLKTKGSIN